MLKEFTWGPVGKKNHRADLRRHGDFVFPATPQVFYWAYISAVTQLWNIEISWQGEALRGAKKILEILRRSRPASKI